MAESVATITEPVGKGRKEQNMAWEVASSVALRGWVNGCRKTHPHCRQHHPMVWGPRLNRKKASGFGSNGTSCLMLPAATPSLNMML